jgi:hypothetical protein
MVQKGSCLCQKVTFEIDSEFEDVLNCHCTMCRKLHASAFRTRAKIKSSGWKTLSGDNLITFYESSPGEHKGFCSNCGSSLFTKFDGNSEVLGFPLGTLDTNPNVQVTRHIFVANKADWHEITDDLPQHQEFG